MNQEFIIGLVNHRKIGRLFQAFVIKPEGTYYEVISLVRERDIERLNLNEDESELVRILELISDEELTNRFSAKKEVNNFINNLDSDFFKEHINPYIDTQISKAIKILMNSNIRLFRKDDKYSNLYDEDLIKIYNNYVDCRMCFNRDESGIKYRLQLRVDNIFFPLLYKKPTFIAMTPAAFIYKDVLYAFKKLESTKILPFLSKKEIFIPKSAEDKYLKTFVKHNVCEHRVQITGFRLFSNKEEPKASLNQEIDITGKMVFIPKFEYGNKSFYPQDNEKYTVEMQKQGEDYIFIKTKRNFEWEQEKIKQYLSLGLIENNGSYYPKGTDNLSMEDSNIYLFNWLNENNSLLSEKGIIYRKNNNIKQYSNLIGKIELELNEYGDWFDLNGNISFGKFKIPFINLRKYILSKTREFTLPNGEIAVLPKEWVDNYSDIMELAETRGNKILINKYHYPILQNISIGINNEILNRLKDIGNTSKIIEPPKSLNAILRHYQSEGYSWLYQLYTKQFGACLADDMGLGKTLQTISLLLKLKRTKQKASYNLCNINPKSLFDEIDAVNSEIQQEQPASLIIMPTSLIHNWQNELEKFAPELKVCIHYGNRRTKNMSFRNLSNLYDIILTTYGTVRNDIDLLQKQDFFYIILDESQYIKNPNSKIYKAISQLKSQNKLVLTGTPIENSLIDLWAQMNFINPGLLGNLNYFKRIFQIPIEKRNDEKQQNKLKTLIRPFIIRRTKNEVAKDLPPITEQIRYCKMAKVQNNIYEKEKLAIRIKLLQNIENNGVEKSSIMILQALSRLRQLANHPNMLNVESDGKSGKFDEITDTLINITNENHKVLIFSSFVKHLEILECFLKENKLKYSLLTGETKDREQVIKSFQDDDDNKIFLISLKAGGVGLNLTQADYVFILDPWWNPAAEMQAISRAHRIGQNKKVMIYRFISEASVEEKIISLQEKKSKLAEQFINSNNPFRGICKQEIIELFS